jgi:hypothetical protein
MNYQPRKSAQQADPWTECSINVELDLLPSFLELIAPLIDSGFERCEVQRVLDMAKGMFVDEERSLKFPIVVGGRKSFLIVRIFMDDIAAPDIYLTTEPSICKRIYSVLDEFTPGV